MASGVAHDFNNLLMSVQGNTSLILLNVDSKNPNYERLKNIEQSVQSGAELTRQLLGFAKGGVFDIRPTNLNDLIKRSSEMFGRTRKEIKIHGEFQKNIWTVAADQMQLEQVLLNLQLIAWQAMPGGGDLYFQTENVALDKEYLKPFDAKPGRYVKISVRDTGVGMDQKTQQRIFDPFFTTKTMGKGTGLGLASAYGIIKNHGGLINIHSEKGKGTTFSLYLPASEKIVTEEKKVSEEVLSGTETILFVDDEDMVIEVGKRMLEKIGYKVLLAGCGKDAVKVYQKNKGEIDIVILDMVMPDIGGGEAFDMLREINSELKVLLSSGYSIDGQASEIMKRGCDGFIQKPFNIKQVSQKLRGILDKD
jgi:CheY-like chemotaxis protein